MTPQKEKMVSIVVAASINGTIGKDNKLPWHLPDDLKRFRKITEGGVVIMGRNTFESIGRPLPGRDNIVLSRSAEKIPGVEVADSLDRAFVLAATKHKEVFIIGGADVYRQSIARVNRIYLTEIQWEFEGDSSFHFSRDQFRVVSRESVSQPMPHEYLVFERV